MYDNFPFIFCLLFSVLHSSVFPLSGDGLLCRVHQEETGAGNDLVASLWKGLGTPLSLLYEDVAGFKSSTKNLYYCSDASSNAAPVGLLKPVHSKRCALAALNYAQCGDRGVPF